MKDKNLYVIWHTELKMWLRTGQKHRGYAHTKEEVEEWIEDYKKDVDKNPEWLVIYAIKNSTKNFVPLSKREEASK